MKNKRKKRRHLRKKPRDLTHRVLAEPSLWFWCDFAATQEQARQHATNANLKEIQF
jgi:hypothetical protein